MDSIRSYPSTPRPWYDAKSKEADLPVFRRSVPVIKANSRALFRFGVGVSTPCIEYDSDDVVEMSLVLLTLVPCQTK